ncbi:hypothetical protein FRB90_004570, partial [Tulasnella sp. 427]
MIYRLISFFKRVEPVAARWRNLTLSLDFDLFTSAVPDLLRWPCPNLERLALEDEASRLDFSEVDIFSGSSPKLTEVQVLGITFRWSHSIFKGLERLHLGYLEFDTIGTILNMLRESPRLQQLKIINCGTHLDLAAKPLPVPLPDLQFLHVLFLKSRKTAHLTPYSLFLDHVSAPLSCALFTNFRKREDEEDPIGPCFVRWLFGRQPRAVLEGVDTLELRLGHDDADTLQFILTSGLSTVKGGVRMWTPWHRNRMMACIRDIVNLSRAPRPYTKLNIGQHGARLFGPFIFQLDKFPPVTHLEMVDCGRPGYHDAIKYTLTERSSPTCSSIQSLAFRDFRSDVVNMVVQAALGGGGTLTSSESGRRTMEKIAIYVKSHEFPEMEAMVKTLRLDERILSPELMAQISQPVRSSPLLFPLFTLGNLKSSVHLAGVSQSVRPNDMEKEPTKTLEATARMARSADQPPGNLNEAPPIHRTPLELLLCIFKHILSFDCDEEEDAYYRELCTLSTVCARWYSIIRNSPRLWTKVPDSVKEDGLPMILEPSVGCIVDVVYKMEQYALGSLPSSHRLIRFLKRVESAAARWRSLTLSLYAYLYTSPVLHALRLPCPNLARLNLQDNECLTDISEVDIFSGSAPKLIDVRVLGITCQWSQAVFKELERLHLQLVEFSTVGTILDMLRDCPRLQKLEIVDCSTHFDLPVTATRRPVSLPDLQVLYVSFRRSRETDYQTPYSQMLDHIAVPSSCAFFTSFGREEEDDLVSICFQNWLFARQPRSVLEGVVSLEIRLGDLPNAVDFTLRSGSSTVEGGVTMWAPEEGT